jgi:hypothetical protein
MKAIQIAMSLIMMKHSRPSHCIGIIIYYVAFLVIAFGLAPVVFDFTIGKFFLLF